MLLGACKSDTGQNRSDQILIIYRILDNYYSSVYMDEDSVFTKRFVECVKKAVDERTEEVSRLNSYVGVHVEMTVG